MTSDSVVALSFWRCRSPLNIAAVGYSEESLQRLGSKRSFSGWGKPEAREGYSGTVHEQITSSLARCFTKRIDGANPAGYRASIAIAEMFLKQQVKLKSPIGVRTPTSFDAIMYPSIEGNGDGDNFAILPSTVDSELEPLRVEVWHIRTRAPSTWEMKLTNTAMSFTAEGRIRWDAIPKEVWEAETPSGRLRFEFASDRFIVRDAAGNVIPETTTV